MVFTESSGTICVHSTAVLEIPAAAMAPLLMQSGCNCVSLKTWAQQQLISYRSVLFCLLLYFPSRSNGWIEGQLFFPPCVVSLAQMAAQLFFWGEYTNGGGRGPICVSLEDVSKHRLKAVFTDSFSSLKLIIIFVVMSYILPRFKATK